MRPGGFEPGREELLVSASMATVIKCFVKELKSVVSNKVRVEMQKSYNMSLPMTSHYYLLKNFFFFLLLVR